MEAGPFRAASIWAKISTGGLSQQGECHSLAVGSWKYVGKTWWVGGVKPAGENSATRKW
jgi:hypothetical protein